MVLCIFAATIMSGVRKKRAGCIVVNGWSYGQLRGCRNDQAAVEVKVE
jgi:hypothetical protein